MILTYSERKFLWAELDRVGISQKALAGICFCCPTSICNALRGTPVSQHLLDTWLNQLAKMGDKSFQPETYKNKSRTKPIPPPKDPEPPPGPPCQTCGLPCEIETYMSIRPRKGRFQVTFFRCPSQIKTRKQFHSVNRKGRRRCPVHTIEVRLPDADQEAA